MEAVPRLPMINFDLKTSPENPDFSKIKHLIAGIGENPSGFDKEIKELETLRSFSCVRPTESVEGVAAAKKYYCQLLFLRNRFKLGGSESPFQFKWRDLYSGSKYTETDLNHELACVLYNIGALHTRLGVLEERQDSDGMKMAVAHFQCAAWAFHALPDKFPQDSDSDLSSEVLAFKSGLCLAQVKPF